MCDISIFLKKELGSKWKLKRKNYDLLQYESNRMDRIYRTLFCDFNGKLGSMMRKIWSRGQFHIYFLVLLLLIEIFFFSRRRRRSSPSFLRMNLQFIKYRHRTKVWIEKWNLCVCHRTTTIVPITMQSLWHAFYSMENGLWTNNGTDNKNIISDF